MRIERKGIIILVLSLMLLSFCVLQIILRIESKNTTQTQESQVHEESGSQQNESFGTAEAYTACEDASVTAVEAAQAITDQTPPNSKTFYTKYVTDQKIGNVVIGTKTTQTLFEFPADIQKAKSPCYEISKNGLTGHWDDSEFSLVKECDYKKDRCFAIFEKDNTKYYGVVLVSSSAHDSPSKMIIVPQNVYDELSQ